MTETDNRAIDRDGVMLLGPERVCYLGRLGTPSLRAFGALTLYCSPDRPFRLCRDGRHWQQCRMAVVPPYQPHRIASGGGWLGSIMVEPETVDPAVLSWPGRQQASEQALTRWRAGYAVLRQRAREGAEVDGLDVDRLFLGVSLRRRYLDPRVERVLTYLREDPAHHYTAAECARLSGLSFSRFLHLFKQETGTAFRKLRAWKRARSLLYHVNRRASLTDIALDVGYPDSTHFSHSIRRTYGLTPRDILAGSRRLSVMLQEARRVPRSPPDCPTAARPWRITGFPDKVFSETACR